MVFLVIGGIFHQYIECHAPEDLAPIFFWRARKLSSRICKVRVSHVVHINALRDQKRAGACKVMARAIWSAIEAFDKKNVFPRTGTKRDSGTEMPQACANRSEACSMAHISAISPSAGNLAIQCRCRS